MECESLPEVGLGELAGVAGNDVPIAGRIVFREEALGWIADWRFAYGGKVYDGACGASISMVPSATPCSGRRRFCPGTDGRVSPDLLRVPDAAKVRM